MHTDKARMLSVIANMFFVIGIDDERAFGKFAPPNGVLRVADDDVSVLVEPPSDRTVTFGAFIHVDRLQLNEVMVNVNAERISTLMTDAIRIRRPPVMMTKENHLTRMRIPN